jgi:hypothetical protein
MATFWISSSTGCWVELFERPGFGGRRVRLFGPADFLNLRVACDGWGERVGSLVTGPGTYAQCFQELNFRGSVVWVLPGERVADVSELATEEDLDSIRLFDRPPFASEPGFDAYEARYGAPRERD